MDELKKDFLRITSDIHDNKIKKSKSTTLTKSLRITFGTFDKLFAIAVHT